MGIDTEQLPGVAVEPALPKAMPSFRDKLLVAAGKEKQSQSLSDLDVEEVGHVMGHGGGESGFMQGCGSRFAVLETDKRGVKSKGSWASQVPRRIWKGRELWRLWKIVHNLLTRFEYHQ
ncbi:hypothetical protein V6N13_091491 [Hibiscus sabdariffa]